MMLALEDWRRVLSRLAHLLCAARSSSAGPLALSDASLDSHVLRWWGQ
jgi:hypothetical protein